MSEEQQGAESERESMSFDVIIVGGGPSGLSAAIRLRQLAEKAGQDISVCLLEKGSEIGAHLLSGAVFDPRALNELIPDWQEKGAPLHTPVTADEFRFLTAKSSIKLPVPPPLHNDGNYVISLGELGQWLGAQAEALGVQIFPGFAAAEVLYVGGRVIGVATGSFGIGKDGKKTSHYQPPMNLFAKQTIFAEGCHGSCSKLLIEKYDLRQGQDPQHYSLGIKEIWEIKPENFRKGHTLHSIGWPLSNDVYGGSWLYHYGENLVSVGYVVGLDYKNPYLSPYEEMQRFKTHPLIRPVLAGGRRIAYGARALVTGGLQSLPKLTFPGGCLAGDCAGFLNVPRLKGNHAAMKSGMLAAEAVFAHVQQGEEAAAELSGYREAFEASWLYEELYRARNIKPAFKWGLLPALALNGLDSYIFRGKAPWTLRNPIPDHAKLKPAADCKPIVYAKPDGELTFDRLSSVFLSNTNHEENQPAHLTLKDASVPQNYNLPQFDGPEQRYCPAGVYEFVDDGKGGRRLQINAQNCVHCKTCDIKDPSQNIHWITPEGGGGPNYPNM